jgi:L-lactate dehydrogenase (cytochrome)
VVGQQTHHTDDALRLRARVLGSDQVDMAGTMFDAGVTFADIEWLRAFWRGPLVVKGIQTLADAHAVIDRGADGVVVSNHGGRQLDRTQSVLRLPTASGRRAQ